jgi:hypothetical protein
MVFRFWGPSGRSAGEGAPVQHPGVLALIEDAVAARRGVFVAAREQLYVSGLKHPADALVVSRQVQLGLEGFRGRHAGPVAVSIAIDATAKAGGQDPASTSVSSSASSLESAGQNIEPPHDLVTLLKLARPAQVLLTHDLCRQVEGIKGLPLKSFPGRFGVYEYLWTTADKLDLLQSEPQLTLAALPAAATPVTEKKVTEPIAKGPPPVAEWAPAHTEIVAEKPPAFQSPKILALAGVGVVVLVAAVFGVMHLSHGAATGWAAGSGTTGPAPSSQSAPAVAPLQTMQPARTSAPPAVTHTVPDKPRAASSLTNQTKQANNAAEQQAAQPAQKPAVQPAPPAPAANCILGANAGRYVALAEQARGRGNYADAIRIFREVLDCDPSNVAARDGLDKAQRGAQSH